MLCADTNCWIAYLAGAPGGDVDELSDALDRETVLMAPVVLAELFSDAALSSEAGTALRSLPLLEPTPGYWERAGVLRASLRRHRFRPKLADTLIAQSCLDYGVGLLTRDRDFRPFGRYAGLRLLAG